ncbi:MAG: hypothetical protein Q9161_005909 [Pseudevernia consocians]
MQPTVVPTKYVCEELTGEFAEYWKTIQEDDGNGLEVIQLNALARWHAFRFKFGKRTEEYALPHDFFVEIFDDYFFLGSLRQYIKVELVDEMPANSDWKGISKRKGQHVFLGLPEVQIEIKRPPNQLWTKELIQEHLDTLLHEMTHAFLMIYSSTAAFAGSWHYPEIVETEGLTGHGSCWVVVAAAIAAEADRSLGALWDKWDLGIANAQLSEREALRRWHDCESLNMIDEQSG